MKSFHTLIFVFFLNLLFGQYYTNDYYFEEYLFAIEDSNYVHSIDSIIDGSNKLFVIRKTPDFNIEKAEIHNNKYVPNKVIFLNVEYHNKKQIKNLLVERTNGQKTDTLKYMQYDKDGKLIYEQYFWDAINEKGTLLNGERIFYNYEDDKIIGKKIQIIRLKNNSPVPINKWVDFKDYKYEYFDNDSLKNIMYKLWDFEENEWKNKELNEFHYANDTTFNELSLWSEKESEWKTNRRFLIYYHDNTYDKLEQVWKKNQNEWENYFYYTHSPSVIPGYINSKSYHWEVLSWHKYYSIDFYKKRDTIVEYRYIDHGANIEYNYLLDSKGQLLEKWNYFYNFERSIYDHTINTYDHLKNIIGSYTATYYSNSIFRETYKSYYWHSEKINLSQYIPFVDSENEWNVGYFSQIGDTLSKVVNYSFSKNKTFLNGWLYNNIIQLNSTSQINTDNYFREKNGKVWKYKDTGEELWFDFTLEKGDSFYTKNKNSFIKVDSIDYITMKNGEQRKRLFLKCYEESDHYTIWVEGIGELSGIDYNLKGCYVGNNTSLLCFHNKQQLIYKNKNEEGCWITSEKDIEINKLKIIPNPAYNYIKIKTNDTFEQINIYNSAGQLLITSNEKRINIDDLNPGLYIVKMNSNNKISIGKFIKL